MDRLLSEKAVIEALQNRIGESIFDCIKAIPPTEPTEEQIKAYIRKRKMVLVEDDFMKHIIKGTSEAYKGMTNGEVIESVFDVKEIHAMTVTIFVVLKDGTELEFKRNWWNAPYKVKQE